MRKKRHTNIFVLQLSRGWLIHQSFQQREFVRRRILTEHDDGSSCRKVLWFISRQIRTNYRFRNRIQRLYARQEIQIRHRLVVAPFNFPSQIECSVVVPFEPVKEALFKRR